MRTHAVVLVTVLLACFTGRVAAEEKAVPAGLELRDFSKGWSDDKGISIPPDAVRVFVYEGGFAEGSSPICAAVTAAHIAVDYGRSGVLFDRKTGQVVRRLTVADGWPAAWRTSTPCGTHTSAVSWPVARTSRWPKNWPGIHRRC